jgi:hypothetical protein
MASRALVTSSIILCHDVADAPSSIVITGDFNLRVVGSPADRHQRKFARGTAHQQLSMSALGHKRTWRALTTAYGGLPRQDFTIGQPIPS